MRVLAARTPGGPDQLQEIELADRPLAPGEVRLSVTAVGLNVAEVVQLSGSFQIPAPDLLVPGFEVAGTVTEVSPNGHAPLAVGQRCMALVPWGGYADSLVTTAGHVLPVPDAMDDLTAAAFPVSYATAHVSLCHRGQLAAGETVLVSGASGNVGRAALQVARALGATTIAVDRSGTVPAGAADHVVGPDDLLEVVRRLTGGLGAHVALDLVGGDLTQQLMEALAWEGRLVSTGFASGHVPSISLVDVLVRNIAVLGEDIAGYAYRDAAVVHRALQECLDWYADGLLDPVAAHPRPFDAAGAAAALTEIVDGTSRQKLALVIRPDAPPEPR